MMSAATIMEECSVRRLSANIGMAVSVPRLRPGQWKGAAHD
jgi:hypothetical protein